MKVKKRVEVDSVTYWIYGTDEEIKKYFRTTPIIPAKSITIHTYHSREEWNKKTKAPRE